MPLLQKRRPCVRNLSSTLRYPRTNEQFPIKVKSTHDTKGIVRISKRNHPKHHQSNEQFDNVSCLKKDEFRSLESLFDINKSLNFRDVYLLALDYCGNKSGENTSVETSNIIKSEPFVETLFLQSFSPRTNLQSHISKPVVRIFNVKI